MSKVARITQKSVNILKTEGPVGFTKRAAKYIYYRQFPERKKKSFKDILFINGCSLPHPARYRVTHQMEQLEAAGVTTDQVFYEQLNLDMLKYYHGFVFFRTPITPTAREFIKLAKEHNKTCFYDVDDLVIDTKYTNQIKYVQGMSATDKNLYDDGVNRMRETLLLCDYGITTTERLRDELSKYIDGEVFINRNVASDEMVLHSQTALKNVAKDSSRVIIGYFSGSITHNDDFNLVLPSLMKLFERHKNLYLKIAGLLDIPEELKKYADRIVSVDFMDWRKMPEAMATCDINIAPLVKAIFNEAKSENKWIEAGLVKVVTAASNIGAFSEAIKNGETGVLVDDSDWFQALDDLITDKEKRARIATNAYNYVTKKNTTIYNSTPLARFITSKLAKSVAFVIPSTDISGGVNVIVKHAEVLKRNHYDVTLISDEHKVQKKTRRELPGHNLVVAYESQLDAYFDNMVATLYTTLKFVKKYPNVRKRSYFVQGFETDFAAFGNTSPRIEANKSYNERIDISYLTMSPWCQSWLKDIYGKDAKYAPNGISLDHFPVHKRNLGEGKVRLLIEGDSRDAYKNVDEAFKIADRLDASKYHISYLSYRNGPKSWYHVDKFYNRIPPSEVGKVYAEHDILIKTSLLESFSYPPLEMMATGGYVIAIQNDGNKGYLVDGKNALLFNHDDIEGAVSRILELVSNKNLQNELYNESIKTAGNYSWDRIERKILALYS